MLVSRAHGRQSLGCDEPDDNAVDRRGRERKKKHRKRERRLSCGNRPETFSRFTCYCKWSESSPSPARGSAARRAEGCLRKANHFSGFCNISAAFSGYKKLNLEEKREPGWFRSYPNLRLKSEGFEPKWHKRNPRHVRPSIRVSQSSPYLGPKPMLLISTTVGLVHVGFYKYLKTSSVPYEATSAVLGDHAQTVKLLLIGTAGVARFKGTKNVGGDQHLENNVLKRMVARELGAT
ncbi:hypothetical protein EVAR_85479_1 [Eumeta japonica]|uniref:Uncharacterized protein n=1 Tax=Eumeta variegata TaxID=151549 RepID=A0A4C1VD73_EUMVA|nr:hypothetical protein EVAR_85479_1 [Eumeta japonica]